jgi:fatty-acyl-CoA synthase
MYENYASIWEQLADAFPDDPAAVHGDRQLDWRDFDERSARLTAFLADRGVGHESKVAAFMYNCNEYLEMVFATFKLRAVPINVNYRFLEDELAYILEDSDTEVLLFHASLAPRVEGIRARYSETMTFVQVGNESAVPEWAFGYEAVIADQDPMERIDRTGDDHYILYTGGTTGAPKGVVWRHEDLFATLTATYVLAGLAPPDRLDEVAPRAREVRAAGMSPTTLPASPLIHGAAFFLAQTALTLGGKVVFLTGRSFDADELWQTVERHRVTQLVTVGDTFAKPMIAALEGAEERSEPYDVSSVTQVVSTGVMWTAPVKQRLLDYGDMLLVDMLGSSEGGPFGSSIAGPGMPVATARFMIGDRAKLLRDDGSEIEPGTGEVGTLAVAEPIPTGYYKDSVKSAEVFRTIDGVRYAIPGDQALVAEDGTLTLLGRGAAVINSGGEKIYAEEVEEAVKLHAAVTDCVVVGLPDDRWGAAVTAVVEATGGGTVQADEITAFVRTKLAGYKCPKHVVFVERIERSPAGKANLGWAKDVAAAKLGIDLDQTP